MALEVKRNGVENFDGPKKHLIIRNVHAQLLFTTEVDHSPSNSRRPPNLENQWILIDFLDAVKGLKLFCSDLTDYFRSGDEVRAEEIVVDDKGNRYAKNVEFDFDPSLRAVVSGGEDSEYFVGRAVVEHVGESFAGVKAQEAAANQALQNLLMPITAFTKDSVPFGKKLSQFRLSELAKVGDTIVYKVPKNPFDQNPRDKNRKLASARKAKAP